MILTNTEQMEGYTILEELGIVSGNMVAARHVGTDIASGLKQMVGGELRGYTKLMKNSRQNALKRMIAQAEKLGADAVINVRFVTSGIMRTASELLAYGTAVKLQRK